MENYTYEFIYNCFKSYLNSTTNTDKKYKFINNANKQVYELVSSLSIKDIMDIVYKLDFEKLKTEELLLFLVYLSVAKQKQALEILDQLQYDFHNMISFKMFSEKDVYDMIESYKDKIKKEVD